MKSNIEPSAIKQYQWSQDWANSIAHTDINKVIEELTIIEQSYTKITPELLIQSSKNKKSVLHSYFQWDDEKAAHSWRLVQANKLLRHIEVTVIKNGESKTIKVYETVVRNFDNQKGSIARFDQLTPSEEMGIKKIILSDLKGIRTRLSRHNFVETIIHIDQAIESLSKEEKLLTADQERQGT